MAKWFSDALAASAKQVPVWFLFIAALSAMFYVATKSSERISSMAASSFAEHTRQVGDKIDSLIVAVNLLAEKQEVKDSRTYEILGTLSEVVRSNTVALQHSADARNRLAEALMQLGTVQTRMEGILMVIMGDKQ